MDNPTPSASVPPRGLRWLKAGTPLLITIALHVVLIGGAAAIIIQQSTQVKKKTFEAAAKTENVVMKQVEHRLQVARRGGAAGATASPVSAARIFAATQNALQMPAPPDLPSVGTSSFGGFAGSGSGVAGTGAGMSTGLGNSSLGSSGFMSMSFLGMTSQKASRVAFVVDTSAGIMDLRKGGFRAFTIIREEIMRLVSRLPPAANFNVILFGDGLNLFSKELIPATTVNKEDFFAWMGGVNADYKHLGPNSAARQTPWMRTALPANSGIDPQLLPPTWANGVRAALEQKADVVFVITSGVGAFYHQVDEATMAKRREAVAKRRAELEKQGIDINAVQTARQRSGEKARREFEEANRKLVAAGKDPVIITDPAQIFSDHVQTVLRRNGITITRDITGWTDKDGRPINIDGLGLSAVEGGEWSEFYTYLSLLQRAYTQEKATINTFLFVGPNDQAAGATEVLTAVAKRNGGKFQLLTTKRLEELKTDNKTTETGK